MSKIIWLSLYLKRKLFALIILFGLIAKLKFFFQLQNEMILEMGSCTKNYLIFLDWHRVFLMICEWPQSQKDGEGLCPQLPLSLHTKYPGPPHTMCYFADFGLIVKLGYKKVDDMNFFISQLPGNIFWPFFHLNRLELNFKKPQHQYDQIGQF